MDLLQELIWSLKEKEKKLFQKYLQHKSDKNQRKDIQIFNYLWNTDKPDTKTIVKELYAKYSKKHAHTYHSLRNYLKDQLENFILQQKDIGDNQLQISRLVNIAQKLYFHKKYQPAWYYLELAEKIAIKAEEYELLNQIYQHMVEYSWTQSSNVLRETIKKEEDNRYKAKTNRSINFALSVIHNELNTFHQEGAKANIEIIIQKALKEFGVQEIVGKSASQYYKLAILVQVKLEEKKEYKELYRYLIRTLDEMENANLFNKYNHRYRIDLLNIICYSSARAGNYQISEKYIRILEEENKIHPERDLLSVKSFMAKVVYLGSMGRFQEASKILEYLQVKYKKLYKYDDHFFMRMNCNIAALHLHLGNTQIPRKCLNELIIHPNRVLSHHGLEDLFYCHAIECLLIIEANDIDFAFSRVNSIERKFKDFLKQDYSTRNNMFVKILKHIVTHEKPWPQKDFRKKVYQFIALQPIYNPCSEFISFNAWLYSKLENLPYSEKEYNIAIKSKMKDGEHKILE